MAKCYFAVLLLVVSYEFVFSQSCPNRILVDPGDEVAPVEFASGMITVVNSLQEALTHISSEPTEDCFEVEIVPAEYTISEIFFIQTSVTLRRSDSIEGPVSVSFTSNESDYTIRFENASYVRISGIDFISSFGTIEINNVDAVMIENSTFSEFEQGAVDMYQCYLIEIAHCEFQDNGPVFAIKNQAYRGYSGGVSIGFNARDVSRPLPNDIGAFIHDCQFHNNTSDPDDTNDLGQIFANLEFPRRGGAVSVAVNSLFEFNVTITDCYFGKNMARSFGGAVFLIFSGYSRHFVVINDTFFMDNLSGGSAGGISFAFVEGTENGERSLLEIHNSIFRGNRAAFGAALFIHSHRYTVRSGEIRSFVFLDNCTFMDNSGQSEGFPFESGAAVSLSTQIFFGSDQPLPVAIFQDCTFCGNDGGHGGVITTGYLPLIFRGTNSFLGNQGRGLAVIGAVVQVEGDLFFIGSDGSGRDGRGVDGGALYTTSFAQVELKQGAHISFLGNTGVYGAALIVNNMAATSLPETYSEVLYNPLCVFLYEDDKVLPNDWQNVSVEFRDNEALFGSSILVSGLRFCSFATPLDDVFRWDFIDFSNNTNTVHYPNDTSSLWFVETPPIDITTETEAMEVYPGEAFSLTFKGFDELDRPTASAIRISNNDTMNRLQFIPSVASSEMISTASLQTEFAIQRSSSSDDYVVMTDLREIQVESIFTENPTMLRVNITLRSCPIGYKLVETSIDYTTRFVCSCATESNLHIRNCSDPVLAIQEGIWAAAAFNETSNSTQLFTHICPSNYCRYKCFVPPDLHTRVEDILCWNRFRDDSKDDQCSCNRKGVLCGDCTKDYAFSSLLSNCKNCSDASGGFITALALADITVIGILLVVKVGPPAWLYPTLFHVQVTAYLTESFAITFHPYQPYGQYISSALSFYFAYDVCIGSIFTAAGVYLLRYLPLAITIAVSVAIVAFRKWNKLTRQPWYGLWWVTLFQYSHVVHTSLMILNCPSLPGPVDGDNDGGYLTPRWYVNGNVRCYVGFHAGLATLAFVALLFCIFLIPLIFVYSMKYLERPVLLSMSIRPLSAWFREEFPWWPAVELIRRFLFVTFAVMAPVIHSNRPLAMYLAMTLTVCAFIKPYREQIYNYLDNFLTATTLVLIIVTNSEGIEKAAGVPTVIANATNVTDDSCESSVPPVNVLTLIFYYLPAFIFLMCFLLAVGITVTQKYLKRKRLALGGPPANEDFENISYSLATPDFATTNYVDSLPNNTVPLSMALRQLNRGSVQSEDERPSGRPRITPVQRYYQRRKREGSRLSWTQRHVSSLRNYRKYLSKKLTRRSRSRSGHTSTPTSPLPTSRSMDFMGSVETEL